MENQNYYDVLGVSEDATLKEITAAKNALAKKYHPDSTMQFQIDTTEKMQSILEAYHILSNEKKRAEYDRSLRGIKKEMQTFDLHKEMADGIEPLFVQCWRICGELFELLEESKLHFKDKSKKTHLSELSKKATTFIAFLRTANIPEQYWHPDVMNWLLFRWFQNRNYTMPYILTLYDKHLKDNYSHLARLRESKKIKEYQHTLKKLMKY